MVLLVSSLRVERIWARAEVTDVTRPGLEPLLLDQGYRPAGRRTALILPFDSSGAPVTPRAQVGVQPVGIGRQAGAGSERNLLRHGFRQLHHKTLFQLAAP